MSVSTISQLQPTSIWKNFAALNAVPRPSKKEERVIQFMLDFGNQLGLETLVDAIGNVIIKKPASEGMENRKTLILQSHLDMVHQKNNDTQFDFDTQGIEMFVEGDWVKAEGTTLGADNGLGVATMMAILESTDIAHPAIEALFTIDEETGMTGAMQLDASLLSGEILLNLDTEEDDEIGIGCAGGVDVSAARTYQEEAVPQGVEAFNLSIKGLLGGHSGMDIIKGLGNANKLMNRLLFDGYVNYGLRIYSLQGGSLRNAIPRESEASIVVDAIHVEAFKDDLGKAIEDIKEEYKHLEPHLQIALEPTSLPEKVMDLGVQEAFIKAIYTAHNGVYRMSPAIEGLVETSNNIARIELHEGKIDIACLTRSSVESSKWDLANALRSAFELAGFDVEFSGDYPGWTPNSESPILAIVDRIYQSKNGEKANIAACHAGLECGILSQHLPKVDMVSFGPTRRGAHSPDERASISSVQKYWELTKTILAEIPSK